MNFHRLIAANDIHPSAVPTKGEDYIPISREGTNSPAVPLDRPTQVSMVHAGNNSVNDRNEMNRYVDLTIERKMSSALKM